MLLGLSFAGIPLDGILGRVNQRASLSIMCGAGSVGPSEMIAVGTGHRGLKAIVGHLLGGADTSFSMQSGCLILFAGRISRIEGIARRGGHVVGKMMASRGNRPLVKMDMLIGKAAAKAVASVSKVCSLRIPRSNMLRFSCVNCRGVSLSVTKHASFGMAVGRSTLRLGRIMIATVNVRHGRGSLACTARGIDNRRLVGIRSTGFIGSLRKGTSNVAVAPDTNNTNNTSGVLLEKGGSILKGGDPLMIMSNVPVAGGVDKRGN